MTDDTRTQTAAALTISKSGLWTNNVALVQLLGLCPLLAVTGTIINGLGLGIATLITLVLSNSIVSLSRPWLKAEIRIPVFDLFYSPFNFPQVLIKKIVPPIASAVVINAGTVLP